MSGKKKGRAQPTSSGNEQPKRTISKKEKKRKARERFELTRRMKNAKKSGKHLLAEEIKAQIRAIK